MANATHKDTRPVEDSLAPRPHAALFTGLEDLGGDRGRGGGKRKFVPISQFSPGSPVGHELTPAPSKTTALLSPQSAQGALPS